MIRLNATRRLTGPLLVALVAGAGFGATGGTVRASAEWVVDSTADAPDASPGDGVCGDAQGRCTLRAAVEEANATPGVDSIRFALPDGATVLLTLGELALTDGVTITGPGADRLAVRRDAAAPSFRIFSLAAGVSATVTGLTIAGGRAEGFGSDGGGGAFLVSGSFDAIASLRLERVIVTGNWSEYYGGGIRNSGRLTMIESTVSGNRSDRDGGGIYHNLSSPQGNTVTVVNSTISGNSAGREGGGAHFYGNQLTLVNATVTNNEASGEGGGLFCRENGQLLNTIVAGNTAPIGPDLRWFFSSLGHNLVGKSDGAFLFGAPGNGDFVGSIVAPVDPFLGPLANNGGPTPTHALLEGSPAIDAGDDAVTGAPYGLTTDQRGPGFARRDGTVDIGALEVRRATFAGTVEALIDDIRDYGLRPRGIEVSLVAKLNAALAAFEAGDVAGACASLQDFASHVEAQTGKKLTSDQAAHLLDGAAAARELGGCE